MRVLEDNPYFDIEEFAVSLNFPNLVTPVPKGFYWKLRVMVRDILQPIREEHGSAIIINSGYRNTKLNIALKGSPTSQHLLMEAVDFTTTNIQKVFEWLYSTNLPFGQVIFYPSRSFIHIAQPGLTYPKQSFHVHEPSKDHQYSVVSTLADFKVLIASL